MTLFNQESCHSDEPIHIVNIAVCLDTKDKDAQLPELFARYCRDKVWNLIYEGSKHNHGSGKFQMVSIVLHNVNCPEPNGPVVNCWLGLKLPLNLITNTGFLGEGGQGRKGGFIYCGILLFRCTYLHYGILLYTISYAGILYKDIDAKLPELFAQFW